MKWRLAGVYAHPDDDTFSNAGVLAIGGDEVAYTLVLASSGEAGMIADPALATPANLRAAIAANACDRWALEWVRTHVPDGIAE